MAANYKKAEKIAWNKLAHWKQVAITDDRKKKIDSRYVQDFAKEVIRLAESNFADEFPKQEEKQEVTAVSNNNTATT